MSLLNFCYSFKTFSSIRFNQLRALICNKALKNDSWDLSNQDILKKLQKIAPSPSETFDNILWKMEKIFPNETFISILPKSGQCFTFNGLNMREMYTKE